MNKCCLGDIAKSQTGPFGSQLHEEDYVDEGTPIVTVEHLGDVGFTTQNLPFVSEKDTKRLSRYLLKEGDIVFSRVGSIDRCVYVKKEQEGWLFSGRCLRVRCDKEKVNPRYLSYYFKLPEFKKMMLNISVGATMPSLNTDLMDSVQLNLLDRKKQDKIAELLNDIDGIIQNNNVINGELEEMIKTIYAYWFLQFDFPDENGKPYKSSGGKMIWNDELKREIPIGWEVSSLRGKYTIGRGVSYTSKDIEAGNGIPMINLACIDTNRNYKDGEIKYHSGKVPDTAMLRSGDLLIACTDLTRNADIVGSPILVPDDDNTYTYSSDIAKLIPAENIFNKYYMYMMLRTDFYHNYIKNWASGTNVLHLNLDGLNWYKTWIPPMCLQNIYADIVFDIHKKKCEILKENKELSALRDFLLPLLMNGQVGFKEY